MAGENVNQVPENVHFSDSEGIRRKALTDENVIEYALISLGFPVVEVEAERQQLGHIMERTLDEYNKWLPVYKLDAVSSVSSAISEYNLRDLGKPYGRGVVSCEIVSKSQFFSPVSGVFALGIPHPISHLSPDQYDIALRYIGAAKKVYSSSLDWEWQEPVIWLHAPSSYGGPFDLAYQYVTEANSANDVAVEDWGWFKDYFLALLKIAVGNGRAKFGSIPGPAQQSLRGSALVDEGREEKKELQDDLRSKSASRVPPLFLSEKG
jgi:hypothetical protein